METQNLAITVSESIGAISSIMVKPSPMKALVVLAHGAGAGMNHSFMESLAQQLALRGIGTLRYNFPFIEQRKKRPDVPAIAEKTVATVLMKANELTEGTVPIFAAGKSFGGRMSSQYFSKSDTSFTKGLIFYGFPLHPAGAPATTRAAHLNNVRIPMLFLQGTRDALAELSLIRKVCSELPLAKLVTFEGADHSFKSGKKDFIAGLANETDAWVSLSLRT